MTTRNDDLKVDDILEIAGHRFIVSEITKHQVFAFCCTDGNSYGFINLVIDGENIKRIE